jgi:YbbR domain-containing protein
MKSAPPQRWNPAFKLLHFLRRIHIENKGLKVLALLLAILLFALSRQPVSNVRLSEVPLEVQGPSRGVEISSGIDQKVSVRLRGPQDVIHSLMPNQISVIINLNNKEPGERIVQLRPDNVSKPDNVQVVQIEPASLRFKLEPTAKKIVKVEPQFMGDLAEGMEIYRRHVEPPEIEIEGPQSYVNKVHLVLTETVNLSGRKNSFQTTVDVETPHNSLRVLTPGPIKLVIEIGELRAIRTFNKLPVYWLNQTADFRLVTKTVDVELYGPRSAIEGLQADDLRVEVESDELTAGSQSAQLQVRLPDNRGQQVKVKTIPSEVTLKRQ